MLFDKIIYINLDRRPDRNLNVINQLKKVGLEKNTERFSAIDGKTLDVNKIDQTIITEDGVSFAKKGDILYTHLTLGAIGCAMSHRAIYQKIINDDINSCLILEDDITIDDKFNEKIKYIENQILNSEYDLYFLGYHPTSHCDLNQERFNKVYGLFGYIVTKKGAKKLLDLFPITYQIDTEISRNSDKIIIKGVKYSDMIILSDQSQYSYKFGTDIQNNNGVDGGIKEVNHINEGINRVNGVTNRVNGENKKIIYVFLAIFIILCIIIIIFMKMI